MIIAPSILSRICQSGAGYQRISTADYVHVGCDGRHVRPQHYHRYPGGEIIRPRRCPGCSLMIVDGPVCGNSSATPAPTW